MTPDNINVQESWIVLLSIGNESFGIYFNPRCTGGWRYNLVTATLIADVIGSALFITEHIEDRCLLSRQSSRSKLQ